MIAYKFLDAEGRSAFTRFQWPLPDGGPGAWVEAQVDPCRSGIHACRPPDLPFWVGRLLYAIELDGDIVAHDTKVVAPRGRLLRRVEAWSDSARDDYTRMCADRARELARGASLNRWEAVIEPSMREGPALLSFIAARIAEEIDGRPGYQAERSRHSAWLVERLELSASE